MITITIAFLFGVAVGIVGLIVAVLMCLVFSRMAMFVLIFCIFTLSAGAQTNIYTANMTAAAKQKVGPPCTVSGYYYVGLAVYIPPMIQPSNKWYYQTTNVHTISCTNSDAVVQYIANNGEEGCAKGSITWTDSAGTKPKYRFEVYWSNNIVVPTNLPVPLATTGFRTNPP